MSNPRYFAKSWRRWSRLSARPTSKWLRAFRIAIVLPLSFLLIACSLKAYRIYALNRSVSQEPIPLASAIQPEQSVLIVSPHPDDECLGTAGLIQAAVHAGAPVHVVFMTSGDGFKFGVSRFYHKIAVGPSDFKRYGEMRMNESRQALATLGLADRNITFLGYPDRGLMAMWRDHWASADPFKSMYSESTRVVYPEAYHPNAPFSATSVLSDLIAVIRANKPTDVYVTHPNDDHDDHSASSAFTAMAVDMLRASGEPWARNLRLHYYLVHRGDWPVPQGFHKDEPLSPPAQLLACGTDWSQLPLSPAEEQIKYNAINKYDSQEEMMGRFLHTFVRRNEIFGDLPSQDATMASERPGEFHIDGSSETWPGIRPIELDPVGDNVLLSLQKGADIRMLSAYHDAKYLYVRMDTNGSLLPEVHYVLHIRAVDLNGQSTRRETAVTINPRTMTNSVPVDVGNGIYGAWDGETIEVQVPLIKLDAPHDGVVFIEGVTHFSNVPFDRTGPRAIRIHLGDTLNSVAPLT